MSSLPEPMLTSPQRPHGVAVSFLLRLSEASWTFSLAVGRLNKTLLFTLLGNVSNMGARVVRMIRNFNLENRVHREISREKPRPAPRHDVTAPPPPAPAGSSAGECPNASRWLAYQSVSTGVKPGLGPRLLRTPLWKPPDSGRSLWHCCVPAVDQAQAVHQKNDPLLDLLKSVYVESTDPAPAEVRTGHWLMLTGTSTQEHLVRLAHQHLTYYYTYNLPGVVHLLPL